jgi:hypothetical protein
MDYKLAENLSVSQWLEHRTVKFVRQINLTLGSVAETKPDCVGGNVTAFNDLRQHGVHTWLDGDGMGNP